MIYSDTETFKLGIQVDKLYFFIANAAWFGDAKARGNDSLSACSDGSVSVWT